MYLHVHVTRLWLLHAGAQDHLIRRVVFLALRLAEERDEVRTLAVAGFSVADVLLAGGAFELSRAKLGSLTLPPVTANTAGFVALVTTSHAIDAVLDAAAPMAAAAEIAGRFDVDSLAPVPGPTDAGMDRFVFGSVDAGIAQMWLALEAKEPDRAVNIGQNVNPARHPLPVAQAQYWLHHGRALAQLRGRHDDAVRALRTAEGIFPTKVLRDPFVRDTLAVLLRSSRRGSPMDQELRGMARRAGLPV